MTYLEAQISESAGHATGEPEVFYCTQYYYFGYEGLRVTEAETLEGPENPGT